MDAVELAVLRAINTCASNASLPIRFDTDDDALTDDGEVSYVDVNATFAVVMTSSSTPNGGRVQATSHQFEAVLLEVCWS